MSDEFLNAEVQSINGDTSKPPVAEDDYVRISVDSRVTVTVLNKDESENDNLAVILLNQPSEGAAVVNSDGTITFAPDSGFEGTVNIHYLIEDAFGGTSEATLTIEVESEFAFGSFANFTRNSFGSSIVDPYFQPSNGVLSQQVFALAPEPIFNGCARPGTQIVGRLYDAAGARISTSFSTTDPDGNWMIQFQHAQSDEFYRVEFEQIIAAGLDADGYLGVDSAGNTYPEM